MPRLPECKTTHTRDRSSTQTSTKWLPDPSVPNCLATFIDSLRARSDVGRFATSHSPAARDVVVSLAHTGGDRTLDAYQEGLERVGKLVVGDVELGRDHAATNVDADRGRNHRALRGDDRTDGCADTDVRIGHERDMTHDDRKARGLLRLADGVGLDVARPGDQLVVDVGGHVTPTPSFSCSDGAETTARLQGRCRRDSNPHPPA